MDRLPFDLCVRVLDYLQYPAVALISRRMQAVWKQNFSTGRVNRRWMRIAGAYAPVLGAVVGEAIPRTVWFDNVFPLRCALSLAGSVRRLVVAGSVPRTTEAALSAFLGGLRDAYWFDLRSLEVRVPGINAGDGVAAALGGFLQAAPALNRLSLNLSMNALSIRGLTSVVDGVLACEEVRDLCLNVSGNWIRGVDYGRQISRLHALPCIEELTYRAASAAAAVGPGRAPRDSDRRSTWGAGACGSSSACSTSRRCATRRASAACASIWSGRG
jgi:hypothetical protein